MAERKFVYHNPAGDAKRVMVWEDDAPEEVHVYTEQDMTQTIEMNKVMRERQDPKSSHRLIARGVPITVAEKAIREQWDEKDWAKWLNDPDNAAFRIYRGWV